MRAQQQTTVFIQKTSNVKIVKSRKERWAGYLAIIRGDKECRILVGKCLGELRWQNNTVINLR
jgi:hypothetical protein